MAQSRFTVTPRRLLLLSTALVAVSVAYPGHAETPAQLAQAETSRQVALSIPAQSLDSALTTLADQANLRLVFRSEDVAGARSAGLSGSFTADEALRRLLAGTGMVWRFTDAKTVTLEKVAAEGALQLDPVSVEGQVPAGEAGYYTENSRSYGSRIASIGSKEPTTLREIPQSVSVVTRQRMDDQGMTRLEDAMRKTTGMTVLTNDSGRSSIYSRGFELDQYMVDGLPGTISSIVGTQPDLAMFDHIEVLRGPAGLFGGSGDPGGTVNLVRKRAKDTFGGSASATVGSWNTYKADADVSTALVDSKAIRGRVVASYQDGDSFVDQVTNKSMLGYGTLDFDLTPDTTMSVAMSHLERDITPSNGLPAFANGNLLDVDRSTFTGADWNYFNSTATEVYSDIEHRLDKGGVIKASLRYTDRDADFQYAFAGGTGVSATNTFTMTSTAREYGEEAWAGDAHISQPFQVLGQTQTLTGGVDFRRSDQVVRYGNTNISGTYSLNSFNSAAVTRPTPAYSTRLNSVLSQYSAYGQAKIKPVAPLTAVLGGRIGNYKVDQDNLVNNVNTTIEKNGEFTPYAGLIWDFHPNLSAYVSHSEIFQPQTSTTFTGDLLAPQKGEQQEVGVKGEFLDGRVTTLLAYFQADIKNRAISDTAHTGSSVAGDVATRGIDAEVSGTVLPGWEVFAGYSYLLSEYTDSPKGMTYNSWTPKHTVTLWTKYSFGEGSPLDGFNVGGGMRAVSSYYGQAVGTAPSGTRWYQSGYQVFDGQVGYQITENLDATFSVNNILDEKYYSRTGSVSTFNLYGEPRSFWLKLGAKF